MQVSFACTDHGLKAPRATEPTKQNTASPNTASAARARFRTVALIARSLGSFTHRHHISLKESTGKLTGMKYRYKPDAHEVTRLSHEADKIKVTVGHFKEVVNKTGQVKTVIATIRHIPWMWKITEELMAMFNNEKA
ncbi:hypothetical protein NFI96_001523 [Prochilodus magdalenae]|nr:hypothetical protein NFI96_001523 [Prochilodus magdalenae]